LYQESFRYQLQLWKYDNLNIVKKIYNFQKMWDIVLFHKSGYFFMFLIILLVVDILYFDVACCFCFMLGHLSVLNVL